MKLKKEEKYILLILCFFSFFLFYGLFIGWGVKLSSLWVLLEIEECMCNGTIIRA